MTEIDDSHVFLSKAAVQVLIEKQVTQAVSSLHTHRMSLWTKGAFAGLLIYVLILQSFLLTQHNEASNEWVIKQFAEWDQNVTQRHLQWDQDVIQRYTQMEARVQAALADLQATSSHLKRLQWSLETPTLQKDTEIIKRLERLEQQRP